ncbi:DUF6538 domain-containing protein [Vibrio sp. E150_011]
MSKDQYLQLQHQTYYYRRRTPSSLISIYGRYTIIKSLQTSDIKIARLRRDQINANVSAQLEQSYCPIRLEFQAHVETLKHYSEDISSDESAVEVFDWECQKGTGILPRTPAASAAYKTYKGQPTPPRFAMTLKEALLKMVAIKKLKADNEHRTKKSVQAFLSHIKLVDQSLALIKKKDVVTFTEELGANYSHGTISATLSRLKSVWRWANQRGEVEGQNPFENLDLSQWKKPSKKKQLFSKEQLKTMLVSPFSSHVKMGLYTGLRAGEISNVYKETIDGIECWVLDSGKTDSAARAIPIVRQLKGIEPSSASSKRVSREFSRFKVAEVTDDRSRSFHSLRVHFITAAQRCGVDEFSAATLAGHETGSTMSFGYYAKSDIKRLASTIQDIADQIDKEWVQ